MVPVSNNETGGSLATFEFSSIYNKPYCRLCFPGGYSIGVYTLQEVKSKFNFWIRLSIYIALWMIAVASCMTIVFGQYQTWHGHPFSKSGKCHVFYVQSFCL